MRTEIRSQLGVNSVSSSATFRAEPCADGSTQIPPMRRPEKSYAQII